MKCLHIEITVSHQHGWAETAAIGAGMGRSAQHSSVHEAGPQQGKLKRLKRVRNGSGTVPAATTSTSAQQHQQQTDNADNKSQHAKRLQKADCRKDQRRYVSLHLTVAKSLHAIVDMPALHLLP